MRSRLIIGQGLISFASCASICLSFESFVPIMVDLNVFVLILISKIYVDASRDVITIGYEFFLPKPPILLNRTLLRRCAPPRP